jgi:FixJ family two-component response regulator
MTMIPSVMGWQRCCDLWVTALLIEEGHRIPVIFLTGFPDENVRNRAIKAGALAFLNKPLVQHDLVESLEKALKVN